MVRLIMIAVIFVTFLDPTKTTAAEQEALDAMRKELEALKARLDAQDEEIKYLRLKVAKGELERVSQKGQGEKEVLKETVEAQVKDYLGTDEFIHEYAKAYPSKVKTEYKVGKGFTFETQDEKYLLEILGRLQTRYNFRNKEDDEDTSSFRINRLRWRFRGHAFNPNLHYLAEYELNTFGGRGQLKDVYVDYHFFPELHLRGGQFKVPYNRQEVVSDYAKQFIDESIVNDAFALGRDIGLMTYGGPFDEHLEYHVGIFTGRGINATENTNNKNMVAARIAYRPFGRFQDYSESDVEYTEHFRAALGAAFAINNGTEIFFNDELQTFPKDAQFRQYGIDTIMKYRGFSLQGEFHLRNLDRRGFRQSTANGFFVQGGYFAIPKSLEFVARFAQVDPNVNVSDDLKREFAIGTNWYFSKNHHHKILANVSRFVTDRPKDDKEETLLSIMHQIEW